MRRTGTCRHCGNSLEWIVDDASGAVAGLPPCETSPSGACEPMTDGDRLIRRIGSRSATAADRRARGFGGSGKRR